MAVRCRECGLEFPVGELWMTMGDGGYMCRKCFSEHKGWVYV